MVDLALHRRLVSRTQLSHWAATHAGSRGIVTFKRAIELAEPATESPMETRLRMMLVLAGLPRPRVQVSLGDPLIARVDLYYPEHRLAIEYDGATHRETLAADNRRQNRLVNAGYRIVRFTATDLAGDAVETVRRAIRATSNETGWVRG